MKFRKKYRNEITAYKFLCIPLIHWTVFFIVALVRAFSMSFTNWNFLKDVKFIGLENYIKILSDSKMIVIFANTIFWTLCITIGHNLIGFAMAYMLNDLPRGEKFFRIMLYWPVMVSIVVGAKMIKYIFNPSPFGFLNSILIKLGFEAQGWYQDPTIALISLMIFPMITGFGLKMIIYQAGLKGIPAYINEAASIDGAKGGRLLWHITLPLLKPVLFLNIVLSMIDGFKILGPMQIVTNGGPLSSTESVVLRIYKEGFINNKMGYATALSFILFAVILVFTLIQFRIQGEEISYE